MKISRFASPTFFIWLVGFIIIVAACSTPAPVGNNVPAPVAATPTQSLIRSARVAEVNGTVRYRASTSSEWTDAKVGQELLSGAQVQTLADGAARLDVSPDAIVRVGADSIFTLSVLAGSNNQPFTRLQLLTGQVWVLLNGKLNGGAFDVETPVGVAAVRGSQVGVDYDDVVKNMIGSCLEGTCDLSNGFGITDLLAEQEASIVDADTPPLPSKTMDPERLEKWKAVVKESQPLFAAAQARMQATWDAPSFQNTKAAFQTLVPRLTPERTRGANVATEQAAVQTRLANSTAQPRTLSPQQIEKLTQVATFYPTLDPTRQAELLTRIATAAPTLNATQKSRVLTVVATLPLPTLSTAQSIALTARTTVTLNATQQALITQLPVLLTQRATLNATQAAAATRLATEFATLPTLNATQASILTRTPTLNATQSALLTRAAQSSPTLNATQSALLTRAAQSSPTLNATQSALLTRAAASSPTLNATQAALLTRAAAATSTQRTILLTPIPTLRR